MKKSPVSKRIGKKPMSLRERPTPRALAAAVIPTPQIMAPANGTVFGPGEAVRVHVSTNRPDLQSIVWLIAPDGTIVDKVAVTWPAAAPFEADVVVNVPDPADAFYTLELEQINDLATTDGGFWVHAIQLIVE